MADPDLHKLVEQYTHHLEALRDSFPMVMAMSIGMREVARKDHLKFLEKYGEIEEQTEKHKTFKLKPQYTRKAADYGRKHQKTITAIDLLPRTFLVSFVSEYDAFLGRLLKAVFYIHPEILQGSDKTMTFSELASLDSMDDAKEYIVEKEVESLLRKSHSDQFAWMENTLRVPLRKGLESWPCFIEITERRNLFVHTDGEVTSQYIKVCRNHGVKLDDSLKIGEHLDANKDYLENAFKCLYEIGVKLAHVLWRKLLPDDLEKADGSLVYVTYELLAAENYDLAKTLLDFGTATIKKHGSDINRRIFTINRAQAYKWSGDDNTCREILDSEDWSACGDNFKLCVAVLRDEYENAFQIMSKIGSNGPVKEHEYLEWPVFRALREQPDFARVFQETFGHPPERIEEVAISPSTTDLDADSTVH